MTKRIPAKQQAATAAKINAIRAAARASLDARYGTTTEAKDACPTCARRACDPYRRHDGKRYTEGCVDAHHHGHLDTPSASADWHSDGASIRRDELKHLESL